MSCLPPTNVMHHINDVDVMLHFRFWKFNSLTSSRNSRESDLVFFHINVQEHAMRKNTDIEDGLIKRRKCF